MTTLANQCFTVRHNYPKEGVTFYDMAPLLANPALITRVTAELKARTESLGATHIVAAETRGYWPGAWLQNALGLPILALKKTESALKAVPRDELVTETYDLEYKKGESMSMPRDSIPTGARILIVDDVVATGGTLAAGARLCKKVQPDCVVVGAAVLIQVMMSDRPLDLGVAYLVPLFCTNSSGKVLFDTPRVLEESPNDNVPQKKAFYFVAKAEVRMPEGADEATNLTHEEKKQIADALSARTESIPVKFGQDLPIGSVSEVAVYQDGNLLIVGWFAVDDDTATQLISGELGLVAQGSGKNITRFSIMRRPGPNACIHSLAKTIPTMAVTAQLWEKGMYVPESMRRRYETESLRKSPRNSNTVVPVESVAPKKTTFYFIGTAQAHVPEADGPSDETTHLTREEKKQCADAVSARTMTIPVHLGDDEPIGQVTDAVVNKNGDLLVVGEFTMDEDKGTQLLDGKLGLSMATTCLRNAAHVSDKHIAHIIIVSDPVYNTWIYMATTSTTIRDMGVATLVCEKGMYVPELMLARFIVMAKQETQRINDTVAPKKTAFSFWSDRDLVACSTLPEAHSLVKNHEKLYSLAEAQKVLDEMQKTTPVAMQRPDPNDTRAVLMWHPAMHEIASGLLKGLPNHLRGSPIQWETFPDGWPNVRFEHRQTLQGRDVVFLASFHDKALITEQISLMIALPRQVIKSLRVMIPYFGPGTMERVEVEGQLATAETLAKMCTACLPSTMGGPPILTFFDMHALCERFYFDDRATVVFESALSLIKEKIIEERMTVVFPDEGAYKRFHLEFKDLAPMVVCSKTRGAGDERKVTIAQEYLTHNYGPGIDPHTQPAIIIDDLVQSGSTLAECATALRSNYAFPTISAYVTHAVFPNNAHTRFTTGAGRKIFDRFFVTNTNPSVSAKLAVVGEPFVVLDICPLLATQLAQHLPEVMIPLKTPWKRVSLCSQSPLKLAAVTDALTLTGNSVHVCGYDSGVVTPNQPIGNAEIVACAMKRLDTIQKHVEDNVRSLPCCIFSIESGIVPYKDEWQEVTCIVQCVVREKRLGLGRATRQIYWTSGPTLRKPGFTDILSVVLAAKGTVTVGELLHAKDPTIPADAWYNRQEIITDALVAILKKE